MNFFSSRPSSPNPLCLSLTSLGKLSLLAGALFSAGALSASEDRFTTVTDLDRWINKSQEHTYSGSVEGSHSGNVFTFALTDGDEISKLDFYGASDAAVLNGNRLVFMQGDNRTDDGEHSFEAAHGATKEANGNAVVIEGGNFLPPLSGYPSDHLISFEAAQGVSDMSGNRIVVTGGDFSGHVRFTAANNTVTENDVTDADFTLADNIIEITGGNFRTNADVEVAYSEIGTLTRNRLEIKGLQNGRLFMAYAANTERGNAYENEIVIDESSLYVQSDFFTASAGSPAPSTLENNILTVTNSTIDSSSFGAAMNASGDVVGNHVEIANTTLKESSGSNLFVYGGLHVGYGGLDGRIAGNVIRLENVTLDLKENQTAFFIAGQISASEGGVLTENAVEIVGDGTWDKSLSKARFVGAQRFGGTAQDGIRVLRETGASTVMYARGALKNPAVFARHREMIAQGALEEDLPPSSLSAAEASGEETEKGVQQAFDALDHVPADRAELALVIRRHAFLARRYSPLLALLKMRTFVPRYVKNLDGARALRQQIVSCTSWEELDDILERHFCDTSN